MSSFHSPPRRFARVALLEAESRSLCRNSNPGQPAPTLVTTPPFAPLTFACPIFMSYSSKLASLTRHVLIQPLLRFQPVSTSLDSFCSPHRTLLSPPPLSLTRPPSNPMLDPS
ncbi:hypothetical protein LX36DRAFT_658143 [Colletotrichum falcatum]|nr:hypothetical protein LX36DRAFT_658143 [Colletotrichum falcatum]